MPRHKRRSLTSVSEYVRASFFGIEDSLVSTTGIVAGVAVATSNTRVIIIAGLVSVVVEAISMGAGEFLSEETAVDLRKNRRVNPVMGGLIMLLSYSLAGLIPLLPILLFPITYSVYVSLISALIGLFILGYIKGKITGRNARASAWKVLIVGGVAAVLGMIVGVFLKSLN